MTTAMLLSIILVRDRVAYGYVKKHMLQIILLLIILTYATVRVGRMSYDYGDTILLTDARNGATTYITDVAVQLATVIGKRNIMELSNYDIHLYDGEAAKHTHIFNDNIR